MRAVCKEKLNVTRTRCGEGGGESAISKGELNMWANAFIAPSDEDTDSTCTESFEQVTQTVRIIRREVQLSSGVRHADSNPKLIPVSRVGVVEGHPVQPTQNRWGDLKSAARQHIRGFFSRGYIRRFSTRVVESRLLQKARRREGRRQYDGLYNFVQCRGECIADSSENCVIHPGMVVEFA